MHIFLIDIHRIFQLLLLLLSITSYHDDFSTVIVINYFLFSIISSARFSALLMWSVMFSLPSIL